MPEMKTAPMASLHGNEDEPQPGHGVPLISPVGFALQAGAIDAKKPLRPIPGARATGTFTNKPIINVKMPDDKVVAKKTPLTLRPVLKGPAIITPFKTMMYAILKKVVIPPQNSK